jgi:hypothetical protein
VKTANIFTSFFGKNSSKNITLTPWPFSSIWSFQNS